MLGMIEAKRTTEDAMVGCHQRFSGHEFEWEMVKDREAWRAAVHGVARVRHDLVIGQQQQQNQKRRRRHCN